MTKDFYFPEAGDVFACFGGESVAPRVEGTKFVRNGEVEMAEDAINDIVGK